MTTAICFNCGTTKFGVFTTCKKCQSRPKSEDELINSLGLSDHHHSLAQLENLSLAIKEGLPIQFDTTQKEHLKHEVNAFLQTPIGQMLTGQVAILRPKKWWEFWK